MTPIAVPHSHIQNNLSSMPMEIKELIIHWVLHLPSTQKKYKTQQTSTIHGSDDDQHQEIQRLQKFQAKSDCLPLIDDIQSPASVDCIFYKLCCPYLFKGFNFQGYKVDKLKFTLEQIIKRHSNHTRNIRWRVSDFTSGLEESELQQLLRQNIFHHNPQWNIKSRSEVLFNILESCPHLVELDIDLVQIPKSSFQSISQLTSLTHLSLSSSRTNQCTYLEPFLVNIISNLSQLRSLTCSRIDATHPKPLGDQKHKQACQSPLGLHLSSLTHLVELNLKEVHCLDSSWNKPHWKSSLKTLSLVDCDRLSISALHDFVTLFQSTLTTLICYNIPRYRRVIWNPDSVLRALPNDKFRFELPKLINLEIISYLPIQVLRAFQHSKNLAWILSGDASRYKSQDLKQLIQDQPWPHLKKFEFKNRTDFFAPRAYLSRRELNDLKALCPKYSIKLNVDENGDEDYSEDEFDEFGDESDIVEEYWLGQEPNLDEERD